MLAEKLGMYMHLIFFFENLINLQYTKHNYICIYPCLFILGRIDYEPVVLLFVLMLCICIMLVHSTVFLEQYIPQIRKYQMTMRTHNSNLIMLS